MTECGTNPPVEHFLSAEDAVSFQFPEILLAQLYCYSHYIACHGYFECHGTCLCLLDAKDLICNQSNTSVPRVLLEICSFNLHKIIEDFLAARHVNAKNCID